MVLWPIRRMSSRVVAPASAASWLPVCRRSWEVEVGREPDGDDRLGPVGRTAEVAAPQPATLLPDEEERAGFHERRRVSADELGEVCPEVGEHRSFYGDAASPSF